MSSFSPILPQHPFFHEKGHLFQLVCLLLFAVAGLSISSALSLLGARIIWGEECLHSPTAPYYWFMQFFSAIGAFLLPALLFAYCRNKKAFSWNAANRPVRCSMAMLYVILLAASLIPVTGLVVYLCQQIHFPESWASINEWIARMNEANESVMEVLMAESGFLGLSMNIFVCAVLPAVCEEFFFRGTLQQLFRCWFGNHHSAIWITAFIFSLIHFEFTGFFARLLLGAYLGYLFVWSGSLWLPIVAHFLHNAISICAQYVAMASGQSISAEPSLAMLIPSALLGIVCIVVMLPMLRRDLLKHRVQDVCEKDSENGVVNNEMGKNLN